MNKSRILAIVSVVSLVVLLGGSRGIAQGLAPTGPQAALGQGFTYQGQLKDTSGNPLTNTCDFQFTLWDALTGGTQSGGVSAATGVSVTKGLFTAQVNAGSEFGGTAFAGQARWLEIAVKCTGDSGYTTLGSRQALTPAPYALFSANSDLLDGQHAAAFQHHPQNVVVVAKSGGDYTTVTDALNSITTNSSANPFLIHVAPGVYTETVTMKPYVDIEGAGELTTKVTYTGAGVSNFGTVRGASDAELRFLTVENTGGAFYAIAIYNNNAAPRLTHVSASASGGTSNFGVFSDNSSTAMMTNVTASALGGTNNYGIFNSYSSPTMTSVTASASGGENNRGVYNGYSSVTMTNVSASASGGTENRGVYNQSSSVTMTNVTASASGGTSYNAGVANYSSSPMMTNVTASASGGTSSRGVYNEFSSPTMTNVTASASGGTSNYGMWNSYSSPTIQSSVISASGGTNDGIHSTAPSGTYTVTINNSRVTGSTSTIYQQSYYTTKVGASQLAGGGAFGGTYVCAASYNGNYAALNAVCQ